tara:strand:+ start:259 stop:630 length:372 start_codon:yes stop_codon:yes gene_type:complete
MDIKKLKQEINEEDFIIRVRPFSDNGGDWNGEVDISVMVSPDNPLDDEDYWQMMHFVKMMCASVPVMEEVEEVRIAVDAYVKDIIDNDMQLELKIEPDKPTVEKTYDGNVVRLTFDTKTGGSA